MGGSTLNTQLTTLNNEQLTDRNDTQKMSSSLRKQSTITCSDAAVSFNKKRKLTIKDIRHGSAVAPKELKRNSSHVYLKSYLEQKSARGFHRDHDGEEMTRNESHADLHMSILDQIVLAQS